MAGMTVGSFCMQYNVNSQSNDFMNAMREISGSNNWTMETTLTEAQVNQLMAKNLGAMQPGNQDNVMDGYSSNGSVKHYNSFQEMMDGENAKLPRKPQSNGSFWDSPFVQQPLDLGRGIVQLAKEGLESAWKFLTE